VKLALSLLKTQLGKHKRIFNIQFKGLQLPEQTEGNAASEL